MRGTHRKVVYKMAQSQYEQSFPVFRGISAGCLVDEEFELIDRTGTFEGTYELEVYSMKEAQEYFNTCLVGQFSD